MTAKQLEQRLNALEKRVSAMQSQSKPAKKGWRALIGLSTDDPIMQEAMALAIKYREEDRREAKKRVKRKKPKK
jgi:phage-related minor tail protein